MITALPPISVIRPKLPLETLNRLQDEWRVAATKRPEPDGEWKYEGTLCIAVQRVRLMDEIDRNLIIGVTEIMADRTQVFWVKRRTASE